MQVQGETIAAIATAIVPQQGSIGIVRLSGATAISIAKTVFDAPGKQPWETHRILYGYIRHPQTQQLIDEALLLIMQAPRSYTREDVIEFHCHGGIIPVQQVLQLCLELGARLAQPGEFTLRAFLNGRLDLTQGPLLMGILNVTPDSFSDGGQHFTIQSAVDHALRMEDAGADILDIGGESTRPYSQSVGSDEELRRVVPVLEQLQSRVQIPISIDTMKASVARAAIDL
nr:dihydropteroate synthase [Hydrococcus sp. Prado102]